MRPASSNCGRAIATPCSQARCIRAAKRHWASLENFNSQRIAIGEKFYRDNDRLLEGGIWAEVTLTFACRIRFSELCSFLRDCPAAQRCQENNTGNGRRRLNAARRHFGELEELKQSLLELDVVLETNLNANLHDREIRIDNGWVVKIGRGLDVLPEAGRMVQVGSHDLHLRKCLETKVDIFRASGEG